MVEGEWEFVGILDAERDSLYVWQRIGGFELWLQLQLGLWNVVLKLFWLA